MATKTKNDKPRQVAIGDEILIDVARFQFGMKVSCRLAEWQAKYWSKIGALVAFGWLERVGENREFYRLTDTGIAYLKRNFPDCQYLKGVANGDQN